MSHRKGMLWCALVAAAALSWAPAARGEVTVLGLRSLDGDEDVAETITRYLRDFIQSRGLDLVSTQTQTLEQMMLLADCGDDVGRQCLRDIADLLEADEIVYGFVSRMPTEGGRFTFSIDARRFSAESRRDVETADGSLDPARPGIAPVQILANMLIDRLYAQTAATTLIVECNLQGAAVFLDGERVGQTGAGPIWFANIAPGEHELRVEKDDLVFERAVDVGRQEYRLVEARLEAGGAVAVGPGPGLGGGEGPGGAGEEPGAGGYWSDWHTWVGWGSVAVAAALAGVGIASTVQVSSINDDPDFAAYRRDTLDGVDMCDRAASDPLASHIRDLCDSGQTWEIVQFVMYGLAAVAAGTGIYMLVTQGEDESPDAAAGGAGVAVMPFGTPGGGGLGLVTRF
jgi:hypothetical protein